MASCNEMKVGDIYFCEICGLELEVKKGCNCPDVEACSTENDDCCDFECCGQPMKKK